MYGPTIITVPEITTVPGPLTLVGLVDIVLVVLGSFIFIRNDLIFGWHSLSFDFDGFKFECIFSTIGSLTFKEVIEDGFHLGHSYVSWASE